MLPEVALSRPPIKLRSVVLPLPLLPSIKISPLLGNLILISLSTFTSSTPRYIHTNLFLLLDEYEYNPEGNYLSIGELDHYSDDSNDYDDYGEAYGYSDNEEDNVDQVNHTKFNKEEGNYNCPSLLIHLF